MHSANLHYVRFGLLGEVAPFATHDAVAYPRGARVVCRTPRGLEVGEVLTHVGGPVATEASPGLVLRQVTVEDDLLLARLARHKQQALNECSRLLDDRRLSATLLDAELLFDGQTLFFYFLGDVPPAVDALTAELAEAYEAQVQFRKFTETLVTGCGPGCGTEEAAGNGCGTSGGCSHCAVASACSTRGT